MLTRSLIVDERCYFQFHLKAVTGVDALRGVSAAQTPASKALVSDVDAQGTQQGKMSPSFLPPPASVSPVWEDLCRQFITGAKEGHKSFLVSGGSLKSGPL